MAELLGGPSSLALLGALLGVILGSFLNVVAHRLPRQLDRESRAWARDLLALDPETGDGTYNLAWPPSHCPRCKQPLRWFHNLPLVSWLALRGQSACCRQPIALRYPLLEGAMGLMTAFLFLRFGLTVEALALVLLTGTLLALAAIDGEWQLLPDTLTLPLLWLGLLGAVLGWTPALHTSDAIIGAAAGYLSLWSLYWGHRLLTKREGMGYGDFKLLSAGGAWLGWQALPQVALLAAASGLAYALTARLRGRLDPGQAMPFGPFLAAAIWLTAVFGVR
ncbi:MAG: prepilin peptidase [Pseudomonadales bacterium]|nr:prepilin peptidase [Pseudomonadales bacterium]